jgi:hypothetical protein
MSESFFGELNLSLMLWELIKLTWPFFASAIALGLLLRILENVISKKSFKYFLRKNRIEFLTFISAVVGYFLSFVLIEVPKVSFILSVAVTFFATSIIIYSKTKERDFYFISLQKDNDKEDWMGEGIFQRERIHHAYAITNSYSGFIFSKCLTWSDYSVVFEFKILKTSLGAILRATNLSNLVMLQIFDYGIKAHIRINGFWKPWEPDISGLLFEKKLNLDKWHISKVQCDKDSIHIIIFDEDLKLECDRVWKIPSGQIYFSTAPTDNMGHSPESAISSIPFPINLEYGTIGFRNDGQEKALVKNMFIEKL